MEIENNEYIRTNNGTIAKIKDIEFEIKTNMFGQVLYEIFVEGNSYYEVVVKHSKNIIDLIEVGDYVNGDEVIAIDYIEDENGNAFNVLGVYDIDDDYAYTIELSRIHIKTILTKEQYEQNSYKI